MTSTEFDIINMLKGLHSLTIGRHLECAIYTELDVELEIVLIKKINVVLIKKFNFVDFNAILSYVRKIHRYAKFTFQPFFKLLLFKPLIILVATTQY